MWYGLLLALMVFFAPNGHSNDVSCAEFYNIMNSEKEAVILDVRIYEEYRQNRIPGAVYAGEKDVLMEVVSDISKETPLLIYCDHGERSLTVCDILMNEGFQNLFHLEEGFQKWRKLDFPMDDTKMNKPKK